MEVVQSAVSGSINLKISALIVMRELKTKEMVYVCIL